MDISTVGWCGRWMNHQLTNISPCSPHHRRCHFHIRPPTAALKKAPNFQTLPLPPPCQLPLPCRIPSWRVLIRGTDNLIMRRTYYWYYAAEVRLPWPPSERHLIFSPPSSLSMGPSVVENEFSLICMTDKHILYLSHRRSYAMDLGTRTRETESEGVKWCVIPPLWKR